jgi:restriction endonuclease Mrr
MWESLIIVSVILVFFFTRNENKKREEQERIEEERVIREEERVLREKNEREEQERIEQERIEEERVLREQNKREEQERREQERLNREFWFELDGLETERELNKVFEKLGYKSELTPPQNDEGIDHVLNGEIVVQTKNTQSKVSRPDLQRFWGSWKDSHKKGIFVSIHGFSNTCEEFVKLEDKPILLYDVDDVVRMMEGKKPEWKDSSNKDSEGS